MKTTIISILLFFSASALAQGMDQEAMKKMMIQVKKMQACIARIDKKKMDELKQRLQRYDNEINRLCKSGKRAAAQAKAISTAKTLLKDKTMIAMSNCTKLMKGVMMRMGQSMPTLETYNKRVRDNKHHVCNENM